MVFLWIQKIPLVTIILMIVFQSLKVDALSLKATIGFGLRPGTSDKSGGSNEHGTGYGGAIGDCCKGKIKLLGQNIYGFGQIIGSFRKPKIHIKPIHHHPPHPHGGGHGPSYSNSNSNQNESPHTEPKEHENNPHEPQHYNKGPPQNLKEYSFEYDSSDGLKNSLGKNNVEIHSRGNNKNHENNVEYSPGKEQYQNQPPHQRPDFLIDENGVNNYGVKEFSTIGRPYDEAKYNQMKGYEPPRPPPPQFKQVQENHYHHQPPPSFSEGPGPESGPGDHNNNNNNNYNPDFQPEEQSRPGRNGPGPFSTENNGPFGPEKYSLSHYDHSPQNNNHPENNNNNYGQSHEFPKWNNYEYSSPNINQLKFGTDPLPKRMLPFKPFPSDNNFNIGGSSRERLDIQSSSTHPKTVHLKDYRKENWTPSTLSPIKIKNLNKKPNGNFKYRIFEYGKDEVIVIDGGVESLKAKEVDDDMVEAHVYSTKDGSLLRSVIFNNKDVPDHVKKSVVNKPKAVP